MTSNEKPVKTKVKIQDSFAGISKINPKKAQGGQ
jgi:hypothetical protein